MKKYVRVQVRFSLPSDIKTTFHPTMIVYACEGADPRFASSLSLTSYIRYFWIVVNVRKIEAMLRKPQVAQKYSWMKERCKAWSVKRFKFLGSTMEEQRNQCRNYGWEPKNKNTVSFIRTKKRLEIHEDRADFKLADHHALSNNPHNLGYLHF